MGHLFKKQFGQNFLRNSRYPKILVNALQLEKGDIVIEIGPGDGAVTKLLVENEVEVICVELDYDLIPKLIRRFSMQENFHILHGDFLSLSFQEILLALDTVYPEDVSIKVIGSLPYNVSKKIIDKCNQLVSTLGTLSIKRMSFIVQDEVAKEYAAKPPKATFLSNYIQVFGRVRKLDSIPASQFIPKPKVDGGILVIEPRDEPHQEEKHVLKLLKIGFSAPRKTLRNNLKNSGKYAPEKVDESLSSLKISETARASELDFSEWEQLLKLLT